MGAFTTVFSNLLSIIGILFLTAIAMFLLGLIKELIRAFLFSCKVSRFEKRIDEINEYSKKVLKDFKDGLNMTGLVEVQKMNDDLEELKELSEQKEA